MTRFASNAALALLAGAALWLPPRVAAQQTPPRFTGGTDAVLVDVLVTRKSARDEHQGAVVPNRGDHGSGAGVTDDRPRLSAELLESLLLAEAKPGRIPRLVGRGTDLHDRLLVRGRGDCVHGFDQTLEALVVHADGHQDQITAPA